MSYLKKKKNTAKTSLNIRRNFSDSAILRNFYFHIFQIILIRIFYNKKKFKSYYRNTLRNKDEVKNIIKWYSSVIVGEIPIRLNFLKQR